MKIVAIPSSVLLVALAGCAADAINPAVDTVADAATTDAIPDVANEATPDTTPADATPGPEATPGPDATPTETGGHTPADPNCDLNGHWLLSQHTVATALGQTQTSHNWFYYEVTQDGENVSVTKGLHCGFEVKKGSALGADVSSAKDWPAFLTHLSDAGRKGTLKVAGSSCTFALAQQYVVRGATLPFYLDPSKPLPGKGTQESGATPGWADWDGDHNPGITLNVSSTFASGDLYLVQRDWTKFDGTIAQKSDKFKVPLTWNTEASVLGSTNSTIETKGVPDSNAAGHYVWWARLTAAQTPGDDAAICAAVRTLKGSLVPEADAP